MSDYRHLFSTSLRADPDRLHVAAHSHHLWPDAAFAGAAACLEDAARLADRKWERALGEIAPALAASIADELKLDGPGSITFAPNTHEFVLRLFSVLAEARGAEPVRILTTDGEFHSFARQCARWEEAGRVEVRRVPVMPAETLAERLIEALRKDHFDWVFVSQVFFGSGQQWDGLEHLVAAQGDAHLTVDGYHGYMAVPTDLSLVAGQISYLSGGYKYAMAGENACFLHVPDGFGPRPVNTGWFAAFDDLSTGGGVGYAPGGGRFAGSTFDPIGLYRALWVRRMLAGEGLTTERISGHVRQLQDWFWQAVNAGRCGGLGEAELITPLATPWRARYLALRHARAPQWQAALMEQNVITDVRGDVIRFGFGLYHDADDVERLIEQTGRLAV